MARKKVEKKELSHEEKQQQKLENQMTMMEFEIPLIPEPTIVFEVGEDVKCKNLKDAKIKEVLMDGKLYIVEYTKVEKDKRTEELTITPNCLSYVTWMDISKLDAKVNTEKFSKKDKLHVHFMQMSIKSLFTKVYSFGVDFEPEYQRGYVWELEDKIALLDSIFDNVEIGKFAFIENSDNKWEETGKSYEILDGKQRLTTLCEFKEGKFEYRGYKYNELNPMDKAHILNYPVSIAELKDVDEQGVLRYFVKLNSNGKVMDKEHLDKVKAMIKTE